MSSRREDDTRYAAVRRGPPDPTDDPARGKTERLDRVDLRDGVDAAPFDQEAAQESYRITTLFTRAAETMPDRSASNPACTLR